MQPSFKVMMNVRRKVRRRTLLTVMVLCSFAAALAQSPLPVGQVVPSVSCSEVPGKSYALYLPSSYSRDQTWPILFIFDPAGRGITPVRLYQALAERHGFILAASNDSRNGPSAEQNVAAAAMWNDAQSRLSIDARRVYTMGFSGGARVAASLAIRCKSCRVAGVIAHGAGYPYEFQPSKQDAFAYYIAAGDTDFNQPELIAIGRKKEEIGSPYRTRVFHGAHQWAPGEVMADALQWIRLQAMQSGTEAHDPTFIRGALDDAKKELATAQQQADVLAEFRALGHLARDFDGLADVTEYAARLKQMEASRELKSALREELHAVDEQAGLVRDVSGELLSLTKLGGDDALQARSRILARMHDLRSRSESGDKRRMIYARAFNQAWAQGIEQGRNSTAQNSIRPRPTCFS
jgi:poly(3-hydroxybutyrate) depolymerase